MEPTITPIDTSDIIVYSAETLSCLSDIHLPQFSSLKLPEKKFADQVVENEKKRTQVLGLPSETWFLDKRYRPLIVVGPSGVGKSTLINALTEKYPGKFGFSVSHTTRDPRPGEEHGVNYFYTNKEDFETMIEKDDFVEWCKVHKNMYGTAKSQIMAIQAAEKIPLLDIDIQGTEKFVHAFPETNTLFIFPPSVDSLKERLEKRGTETPESLKTRVGNAAKEMTRGLQVDDPTRLIGYRMINDNLEESIPLFLRFFESLYAKELL